MMDNFESFNFRSVPVLGKNGLHYVTRRGAAEIRYFPFDLPGTMPLKELVSLRLCNERSAARLIEEARKLDGFACQFDAAGIEAEAQRTAGRGLVWFNKPLPERPGLYLAPSIEDMPL